MFMPFTRQLVLFHLLALPPRNSRASAHPCARYDAFLPPRPPPLSSARRAAYARPHVPHHPTHTQDQRLSTALSSK